MALTYAQLYDRLTQDDTRKRLFVACRLKAFEIQDELVTVPKHDIRLKWASLVLAESIAINSKFIDRVLDSASIVPKFFQDVLSDLDFLDIADKVANRMTT